MTENQAEIDRKFDCFINRFVRCETCYAYTNTDLFGPYCNTEDGANGPLSDGTSKCEGHNFHDPELESEMRKLQDEWYAAFYGEE